MPAVPQSPAATEAGAPTAPRPRSAGTGSRIPGPRQESPDGPADDLDAGAADGDDGRPGSRQRATRPAGGKARTLTGVACLAVTAVLAVVVAGQVDEAGASRPAQPVSGEDRGAEESASRSDNRQPHGATVRPPAAPTYEQRMAALLPIDPALTADGEFEAVPGFDRAPGQGRKIRYRVDIEKGLGMDGALFATAVQKTLNDDRSWAHDGAMTFERISSGEPEFVITLASPGTTHVWCAKSGLDTSIGNVSCDAAATDRVVVNAYRWAQGSPTYGPRAMHAYREMLINHEVGHRLGHGHVNCRTKGALAPAMQQQTKSLRVDGVTCRPNPWPYPAS
ncbi:DUF3152 domain-containing protein [Streptomyces sp. NPDC057638]|uniref:DUF3152 domain-containing protein n=1 Tax=Streptomyces sp. NPDC057638 TaxID=3346190 RepID=UPI0036B4DB02